METPSSTRRVTRSQTSAGNSNSLLSRKIEESENAITKSRQRSAKKQQQDRSALDDITNDSPIIGLAMGNLQTPSSAMSKKRVMSSHRRTPGSGEALLRGQVKTLLQRVEEEAELSKISPHNRAFPMNLQGMDNSPMNLVLAPTPANTPQILSLSPDALPSLTPQMMDEMFDIEKEGEEGIESGNLITRSLLFDFFEKSERSDSSECSSVVTDQETSCGGGGGSGEGKISTDDDASSVWSIQVNASSGGDDNDEDEEEGDDGLIDELCEGIRNVSVVEGPGPKFSGKHIRFVYNSDDEEIQVEQEVLCGESCGRDGESVVRLRGLPTPKGKHLRFPQEE